MNEDLGLIQEAEKRRYKLLYQVWKAMRDGTQAGFNANDLVKNGIMNETDLSLAFRYLRAEGLLGDSFPWVDLTHEGLVEIEHSIKHPETETEHFSATVIQHFHGPVGIVQAGSGSTGNIVDNSSS